MRIFFKYERSPTFPSNICNLEVILVYFLPFIIVLFAIGLILTFIKPKSVWPGWTIFWLLIGIIGFQSEYHEELDDQIKDLTSSSSDLALFILICGVLGALTILYLEYRRNKRYQQCLMFSLESNPVISDVGLILPAYNEAANLRTVVEEILEFFKNQRLQDVEIVIINDGSIDQTGQIADELAAESPFVKVIQQENQGKTYAFLNGVKACSKSLVVMFETDSQYSIQDLRVLFQPLKEGASVVNGWRINRSDRIHRFILSSGYNFLMRFLFDTKIRDHNSGFKAFRKEDFLRIFSCISRLNLGGPHRHFFPVAKGLQLKIEERPIRHFPRGGGQSYIKAYRTPFQTFFDMLKVRISLSYRRKFLLK